MKNVLFGTSHTGGANVLAPVVKKIKEEGKVNVHVLAREDGARGFEREGVEYYDAGESYDFSRVQIPVSLIVTGADGAEDSLDKRLILGGQKANVKNLSVFDFWGAYHGKYSTSEDQQDFAFLPDKIAIPDEIVRDGMVEAGFDERLLRITGRPCDDRLVELVREYEGRTGELRGELDFDPNVSLVMYASQPVSFYYNGKDYPELGYTELSVLEQVVNAIDSFDKEVNLLVKTHPAEEEEGKCKTIGKLLEKIEGKKYAKLKRKAEYDTMKAALASDVVVDTFSTVLIEVALMDELAISFQPELIGEDKLGTNKYGITVPVYKSEEIAPTLYKALFDEGYRREKAKFRERFKPNGNATRKVVDLVYEMVG